MNTSLRQGSRIPVTPPTHEQLLEYLSDHARTGIMAYAYQAFETGVITAVELDRVQTAYVPRTTSRYAALFDGRPTVRSVAPQTATPPPFPVELQHVAADLMAATGCSAPTAFALTMSSWVVISQHDYDSMGLSDEPRPMSLFFAVGELPSAGKSSPTRRAFRAHEDADDAVYARWLDAGRKPKYQSARRPHTEGKPVSLYQADMIEEERQRKERDPAAITANITHQDLTKRLARGRASQIALASEAATIAENFSFKPGNRAETLGAFNNFFDGDSYTHGRVYMDGDDVRLERGYRLSVCWLGQPSVIRRLIFNPDSVNGFASRFLVHIDDSKHPLTVHRAVRVPWLDHEGRLHRALRERHDEGSEYEQPRRLHRYVIGPDPEAVTGLEQLAHVCNLSYMSARTPYESGFWGRAVEHAFRLAANLRAIERYREGRPPADSQYSSRQLDEAVAWTVWYGTQMGQHTDAAQATEADAAASAITLLLPQAVHWQSTRPRSARPDGETVALRSWLSETHPPGTGHIRGNNRWVSETIGILEADGWIAKVPGRTGRYAVNPAVLMRT